MSTQITDAMLCKLPPEIIHIIRYYAGPGDLHNLFIATSSLIEQSARICVEMYETATACMYSENYKPCILPATPATHAAIFRMAIDKCDIRALKIMVDKTIDPRYIIDGMCKKDNYHIFHLLVKNKLINIAEQLHGFWPVGAVDAKSPFMVLERIIHYNSKHCLSEFLANFKWKGQNKISIVTLFIKYAMMKNSKDCIMILRDTSKHAFNEIVGKDVEFTFNTTNGIRVVNVLRMDNSYNTEFKYCDAGFSVSSWFLEQLSPSLFIYPPD